MQYPSTVSIRCVLLRETWGRCLFSGESRAGEEEEKRHQLCNWIDFFLLLGCGKAPLVHEGGQISDYEKEGRGWREGGV